MAGTVRGTFDLNSRPASSSLRKLRTEGDKTERTFRKVGEALDRVGTPQQVRRVDIYKRKVEQLERAGKRSFRTLRREWTSTDRQVTKSVALQSKEIDHLQTKLEELALMKASPEVDVDGVAESLAQVELLHSRLRALGRERVTPRVGVGATAARATATRAAAGGASAFGGAGGTGLRSLNLGPLSMSPKAWPVLLGLGLPAATNIGGAAVGLGGSLGAGALGAGAIGVAGGGVLTTAIASIASVAVPTAGRLKEAGDALQGFQDEVRQSGRNSVEAREKWREFNRVLGDAPRGTRRFLRTRESLGRRFGNMTRPAREDMVGMMTDPLQAANRLTPQFAGISNRFFDRGSQVSDRFFGEFATGGRSRRFLKASGDEATASLDEMEAIAEHVLGTLMNITVASRPFFREALQFLDEWTKGWLDSTDNIGRTRNNVREMVSHLRAWLRLGGATFKLLKDLLSAGAGPGRGLVFDLTDQLNEWDRWVRRNPRQVRSFFQETVGSTKKLAGALGKVAESLFEISQMLTPLLDQFSGLVSFLGSAGLLTPGGLPLLIGAGAGIRNARAGATSRILGGGGANAAAGVAAGGVIAGAGGGIARSGGVRGLFRGGPRVFGPTPMLSTPYGPMTNVGATIGQGSRGFGAAEKMFGGAGRFARGFGSRFLPFAAISGGLGALSFEGNVPGRVQAGLSSASLGAIPFPKTEKEKLDAAQQSVAAMTGGLSPGELGRRGTKKVTEKLRGAAFSGGDFLIGTSAAGDEEAVKFGQRLVKKELRAWTQELARQEGTTAARDFYRAFITRSKTEGSEKAMQDTIKPTLDKIKELGPRGGRLFAQSTLRWAREAKRRNPELKDEYDELADKIEGRFRRMGRTIEIIHGRIYTNSDSSWRRIKEVIGTQSWAAEREASGAFGQLETEVFRRLRGFGFTQSEAKGLMSGLSAGGESRKKAEGVVQKGSIVPYAPGYVEGGFRQGKGNAKGGRNFAGGGRFAGRGTYDNVPLPGGGLAAPGEFWIGNRHTERRLNTMLAPYGTSVGAEIEGEGMKHSSSPLGSRAFAASLGRRFGSFARGGRGRRFASGGIMSAARLAQQLGLSVGEGPGFGGVPSGGHAATSLHYSGLAYDVSGSPDAMRRYFFAALRSFRGSINELFYDPIGWYIDNGQKVPGSIGGHSDHVHIGFNPGGAAGRIRGAGAMGGAIQQLNLKRRRSRQGGVAGGMAQRGMDAVRAGMEGAVNRAIGARRGGAGRREGVERFMGDLQRYNHIYPKHTLGRPGTRFSSGIVRRIAESAGLSGTLFEQIAHGESDYYPGVYGIDPGGSIGRGLWQITSGVGNDALIAKYGGPQAMFNPLINARAAKEIYDSSGTGAWYGTKYVTDAARSMANARGGRNRFARGGRPRWGGSFRHGGDFTTRPGRPVQFEAGEGLQEEEISVRPKPRPGGVAGRRSGGRGGERVVKVDLNFNGPVHVRSERDLEAIKRHVADGLLEALRQTDSVREREVTG
jgi:hypothetical protein